jgi:hypothetical protein
VRIPGVRQPLTEHVGDEAPVTVGQRAHIVGVGRQGPRSRGADGVDLDSVENLVLFCGACHARVDRNPRIFSVEVLAKYKADHEARMAPKEHAISAPSLAIESVDLSVLPITALPETVYAAPARFRTTAEVVERLPRPRGRQVLPFVLASGSVWAFTTSATRAARLFAPSSRTRLGP